MNIITKTLLISLLPLSLAVAQDESSPSNSPAAAVNLFDNRSPMQRIQFLLEVAQAYTSEDNTPAAINAYERILEIDPEHQQAQYILAALYISSNHYRKAEKLLFGLAEEFPDDARLWNNLAWMYATAEDPLVRNGQKAVKYAQKAILITPYDYHIWNTLSEAYYVSGDYEKAFRAITHMASLITRFGTDITEESVKEYNDQIRKCKRAWDTAKAMKGEE